MKKKQSILLLAGIIALLVWGALTVSCLTTDTAYRVGYDVGSWLGS